MTCGSKCRCFLLLFSVLILFSVLVYSLYLALTRQSQSSNSDNSRVTPSLKFLIVVSRHGNRRPLFSFPNDPYISTKYWSYALGDLTTHGRVQMYNLGMKIRSIYDGFLDAKYSSNESYSTSTTVDRAMMSGEAFLAGLYPPTGYQIWNKKLLWQPIPLYTDSPDNSQIGHTYCPKYLEEVATANAKFEKQNADVISKVVNYLSNFTGNSTSGNFLYNVWDTLICEETEGFDLPDWTKTVYPQPLDNLIGKLFVVFSAGTVTITKLIISKMYIQFTDLITSKINGTLTPDRKLYYYSAHDMTLVALQKALGIPDDSIIGLVTPGSAMVYELHQNPNTQSYSLQVLYIDGSSPSLNPTPLKIPGCNSSCDFNYLSNITQMYRNFTNYEEECASD